LRVRLRDKLGVRVRDSDPHSIRSYNINSNPNPSSHPSSNLLSHPCLATRIGSGLRLGLEYHMPIAILLSYIGLGIRLGLVYHSSNPSINLLSHLCLATSISHND
jgi:hypothetical protein